jgi:hypothetical protein
MHTQPSPKLQVPTIYVLEAGSGTYTATHPSPTAFQAFPVVMNSFEQFHFETPDVSQVA